MLWPVFVDDEPMSMPWHVGDHVSPQLSWWDEPWLGPDLALADVEFSARALLAPDGSLIGQILTRDRVSALRLGQADTGAVTIDGCLLYDRDLWPPPGTLAPTSGTVRRIDAVSELRDLGPDRWIPRRGEIRTEPVDDTAPERLHADPPLPVLLPALAGSARGELRLRRVSDVIRHYGHLLPAQQWQPRGFVVHVDVDGASSAD